MKSSCTLLYISVLFFLMGQNFLSIAQVYDYTAIKGAGDYYNYAQYRIYIPDTLSYVRGIYCYVHGIGGDTRPIVSDPEFTKLCNKNRFALLGVRLDYGSEFYPDPQIGLFKSVIRALNNFAEQSEHIEIKFSPVFLDGYSWGGNFAYWFTWWKPDIVIGFIAQKFKVSQYDVGSAKYVPGYLLFGEIDEANPTAGFEKNRSEGALWALAMQPDVAHDRIVDRNLLDMYFSDVNDIRLPNLTSPEYPVLLKHVEESTGWLGNRSTFEIAHYDSFTSNKMQACWFPSQAVAQAWQSFVKGNTKSEFITSDFTKKEIINSKRRSSIPKDTFIEISTQNSLVSAASASFLGLKANDMSGFSIASAGDVNGDGLDDILIGAYGVDGGGLSANVGETYLVLGRKEADWRLDFELSQSDASFLGEKGNNRSGYSVAAAGDVNGDGLDDILIGSPLNNDGFYSAGKTYLILGRRDADWGMKFDLSQSDASFIGESKDDWSGAHLSSAGDVNGDSFDDFLISAERNNSDSSKIDNGTTYLFLGKSTINWGINCNLSRADASFTGESSYDHAGYSVAAAGDVNGDNFGDFIIGTTNKGTFLILGKQNADWGIGFNLSQADASFIGEEWMDFAGRSIASAGDVNDDGFDDILIGAPDYSKGKYFIGKTYLILGKSNADWGVGFDLSNSDASFVGESPFDVSGYSVAPAGDVNQDGLHDFLIGAPNNSENNTFTGKTYLILGRKLADWGMDYRLSKTDFSFVGEEIQDLSGFSVSPAGDVDGDGYDDILIGAWHNSKNNDVAGQTYFLLGSVISSNSKYRKKPNYSFLLFQNYPNPFNPSTKIKFTIPKTETVKLQVYNTLGQVVGHLVEDKIQAGSHDVEFNASHLPSGIYFYRLQAGGYIDVKKMILLR